MLVLPKIIVNLNDYHKDVIVTMIIGNIVSGFVDDQDSTPSVSYNLETGTLLYQEIGFDDPVATMVNNCNMLYMAQQYVFDEDDNSTILDFFTEHQDPEEVIEVNSVSRYKRDDYFRNYIARQVAQNYFNSMRSQKLRVQQNSVICSLVRTLMRHQVEGDDIIKGLKANEVDVEAKIVRSYLGGYILTGCDHFEDLCKQIKQQGK